MEEIKEIDLSQAFEIVNKNKTKFVWLGTENVNQIAGLMNLNSDKIIQLSPMELINTNEKELINSLQGHVFVCYHGNTSKIVAKILKSKHGVEAFSLKGGITEIAQKK
ncbi:MAG: hypothetical protein M1168_01310 [Candidatus Marsarchaeota archaeon]|nr:hypothetical protein [Candidatus Marsarchaeota archaeon]MCL5094603.1 hypothetical protein [Candidatus Marsarchaeota archaeon]